MFAKQPVYPFLLALLFCTSCGPDGISPKEKLPQATQEGLNTFGCLLNGEVWVPRGSINPTINRFTFYYDEGVLNIAATRNIGSKDISQSISIRIEDCRYTGNYRLTTIESARARFSDLNKACLYQTNSTKTGTLEITKLDTINHIIAGTFAFTVWTGECDTIRVTDGRFDIKYQQ